MTALTSHIPPGGGERHTVGADRFATKLTGTEEFAPYALFEYEAAPGVPGPPPHLHRKFEEAWFVLDGEVEFTLADGVEIGRPGSFLWVPRGAVHTFSVRGQAPARWIGIISPGRYTAMLEEIGALLESTKQPSIDDMSALFQRHDSELVISGPPPA
jgi:quercetin dioxygenase-like cupin family protein